MLQAQFPPRPTTTCGYSQVPKGKGHCDSESTRTPTSSQDALLCGFLKHARLSEGPFGGIHLTETGGSQEELLPKMPPLRSWTPTAQKGTDGRPCVGRSASRQSSALPVPRHPAREPPVTPPNGNPDAEALTVPRMYPPGPARSPTQRPHFAEAGSGAPRTSSLRSWQATLPARMGPKASFRCCSPSSAEAHGRTGPALLGREEPQKVPAQHFVVKGPAPDNVWHWQMWPSPRPEVSSLDRTCSGTPPALPSHPQLRWMRPECQCSPGHRVSCKTGRAGLAKQAALHFVCSIILEETTGWKCFASTADYHC